MRNDWLGKGKNTCVCLINILSVGIFGFVSYVLVFDTFREFKTSIFDGMFRGRYLASDMIPNIFIIIFALLAGIGLRAMFRNRAGGGMEYNKWLIVAAVILFVIQGFIAVHIYHYGWTDIVTIRKTADAYANGVKEEMFYSWYLPQAPNQIYCYALFIFAYKAADFLGIGDGYVCMIFLNIILSNLSCVYASKLVYRFSGKTELAKGTFVLASCVIGTSPWIVFPYTDMLSVLIPVLSLYVYMRVREKPIPGIVKWILISALPVLFYGLKPTNFIIFIAMAAAELLLSRKDNIYKVISIVIGAGLVLAASETINITLEKVVGYRANEDIERDIKWYFLLGSNYDSIGSWNCEDNDLHSFTLETKKEKDKTVPQVIRDRYKEMGISGTLRHWMNKTQLFYNDGTFSWGFNGIASEYPQDDSKITTFMRNLMWVDGEYSMSKQRAEGRQYGAYYRYFVIYQQIVWMVVYTYLGILILLGDCKDKTIFVLKILWIGLFLFSMLFETNARLLLSYLPLFCCMSVMGWQIAAERIKRPVLAGETGRMLVIRR